jgi:hypothetical protein
MLQLCIKPTHTHTLYSRYVICLYYRCSDNFVGMHYHIVCYCIVCCIVCCINLSTMLYVVTKPISCMLKYVLNPPYLPSLCHMSYVICHMSYVFTTYLHIHIYIHPYIHTYTHMHTHTHTHTYTHTHIHTYTHTHTHIHTQTHTHIHTKTHTHIHTNTHTHTYIHTHRGQYGFLPFSAFTSHIPPNAATIYVLAERRDRKGSARTQKVELGFMGLMGFILVYMGFIWVLYGFYGFYVLAERRDRKGSARTQKVYKTHKTQL